MHKQKNRQYLLTVRPFQFGLSFLFYCCIIFFVQWADFPNHRLCPDWLQDMFLTYFLNSKSHYLPFLTLRHDVANFLFWICFIPAPYKIHITTPCRKLFCMLQNLPCDIMSQSSSLTYSKKNSFPVYAPCRSPSAGSVVPSAVSSLPSTSYRSNSSFILIFNWCFIYASTSKAFFLS